MTVSPVKLIACGLGLAVLLSADAVAASKTKKPKSMSAQAAASGTVPCPGAKVFHCGPIYNAYDYLGNDPDPFIRAMIQRDLGAKYGGAE